MCNQLWGVCNDFLFFVVFFVASTPMITPPFPPPPLGGGKTPIFLRHFDFFGFTRKVPANHRKFRVRDGFGVWFGGVL